MAGRTSRCGRRQRLRPRSIVSEAGHARAARAFEAELRKQGCRVAGYRLPGAEDGGYSEFCCKRLVDDWRVITTFEPGVAIVVAVGRHDSRALYAELSQAFAIGAVGRGREEKPARCGKGGWPSVGPVPGERTGRESPGAPNSQLQGMEPRSAGFGHFSPEQTTPAAISADSPRRPGATPSAPGAVSAGGSDDDPLLVGVGTSFSNMVP